ncbi:peroxynitrite isomerase THAP4-like [Ixodes scapularis]
MPRYCAAQDCSNSLCYSGRPAHKFPSEPTLRKLWIRAARPSQPTWKPGKGDCLSTEHFEDEDYKTSPKLLQSLGLPVEQASLKPGVVPSLFTRKRKRERHSGAMEKRRRKEESKWEIRVEREKRVQLEAQVGDMNKRAEADVVEMTREWESKVLQWLLHLVRPWPPLGHLSLLSKMVSCCTISSYFFLCSSNSAFHSSPKLPYLSLNLGSLFLLSSQLSRHAPYLTFPFPGHLHHIRFGPLIHISDLRLELNPLLPLYPYLPLRLLNRIRPFPSYSPKTKFYLLATPTGVGALRATASISGETWVALDSERGAGPLRSTSA